MVLNLVQWNGFLFLISACHICGDHPGRAGAGLWTNHGAARPPASQSQRGWGRISQSVIRWGMCVGLACDGPHILLLSLNYI